MSNEFDNFEDGFNEEEFDKDTKEMLDGFNDVIEDDSEEKPSISVSKTSNGSMTKLTASTLESTLDGLGKHNVSNFLAAHMKEVSALVGELDGNVQGQEKIISDINERTTQIEKEIAGLVAQMQSNPEKEGELVAQAEELEEELGNLLSEREEQETFLEKIISTNTNMLNLITVDDLFAYGIDEYSTSILIKKGTSIGLSSETVDNMIKNKDKFEKSEFVSAVSKIISANKEASIGETLSFILSFADITKEEREDLAAEYLRGMDSEKLIDRLDAEDTSELGSYVKTAAAVAIEEEPMNQKAVDLVAEAEVLYSEAEEKSYTPEVISSASKDVVREILTRADVFISAIIKDVSEFKKNLFEPLLKNINIDVNDIKSMENIFGELKSNNEFSSTVAEFMSELEQKKKKLTSKAKTEGFSQLRLNF